MYHYLGYHQAIALCSLYPDGISQTVFGLWCFKFGYQSTNKFTFTNNFTNLPVNLPKTRARRFGSFATTMCPQHTLLWWKYLVTNEVVVVVVNTTKGIQQSISFARDFPDTSIKCSWWNVVFPFFFLLHQVFAIVSFSIEEQSQTPQLIIIFRVDSIFLEQRIGHFHTSTTLKIMIPNQDEDMF